jgi:hypothetical protein
MNYDRCIMTYPFSLVDEELFFQHNSINELMEHPLNRPEFTSIIGLGGSQVLKVMGKPKQFMIDVL